MKIIGLTRIRNEQAIINDTLNHLSLFCDFVVIYDDCSADNTAEICKNHFAVKSIIHGKMWDKDRKRAEWQNRAELLKEGKKYASPDDWFVYIDADERIEFNFYKLLLMPKDVIAIRMKLFDYYITKDDKNLHYTEREFIGPEYRNIIIAFRNLPTLDYSSPDQREVHLRHKGKIIDCGYIKHYGKSVSIEQWEETCNYYSKYFPKYSAKWNKRKGKAIHTQSSFGNQLIKWEEKDKKGIPLTREIEKNSIY